ncbi:MAG: hypothetical protein WDM78_17120 [Puia sp.]
MRAKFPTRDELYLEEVGSTLTYLKLRKIQRLMIMNQKDLEKSKNTDEQMMFMQTHLHLKTNGETADGTIRYRNRKNLRQV